MAVRPYDVVVWGATGFTGKLVCEYLGKHHPPGKWAMAGRNLERIEKVRSELAASIPAVKDVAVLAADPSDPNAMDSVISKGRVVLAMAGPYLKYGQPVVDSSVRTRTHYADITGETPFMRRSVDMHHAKAASEGTCIVHAVGYDSVPWDIGTFLCADFAQKELKRNIARVDGFVGNSAGGASGGTLASLVNLIENPHLRGDQKDHALDPEFPGPDAMGMQLGPSFSEAAGRYTMPSIMATVNSKVVYRSAGLLPKLYGPRGAFKYQEGTLAGSWLAATVGTVLLGTVFGLLTVKPVRWLMFKTKMLPQPGEGPDKKTRENGFFKQYFIGTTEAGETGEAPRRVFAQIKVAGMDPGYKGTAMMATEAALCLALDFDKLPGKGGVLTPASCMGNILVERLKRVEGVSIEVRELKPDEKPLVRE